MVNRQSPSPAQSISDIASPPPKSLVDIDIVTRDSKDVLPPKHHLHKLERSSKEELDRIANLKFSFSADPSASNSQAHLDLQPRTPAKSETESPSPQRDMSKPDNGSSADKQGSGGGDEESAPSRRSQADSSVSRGRPPRQPSVGVRGSHSPSATSHRDPTRDSSAHSSASSAQSPEEVRARAPPGQFHSTANFPFQGTTNTSTASESFSASAFAGYLPSPFSSVPFAQSGQAGAFTFPPDPPQFSSGPGAQPQWLPPVDFRNLTPEQQQVMWQAHQQILLLGAQQQQQSQSAHQSSQNPPHPSSFPGGSHHGQPPFNPALIPNIYDPFLGHAYPPTQAFNQPPYVVQSHLDQQAYGQHHLPPQAGTSRDMPSSSRGRTRSTSGSTSTSRSPTVISNATVAPAATVRAPRAAASASGGAVASTARTTRATRTSSNASTTLPTVTPGAGPSTRRAQDEAMEAEAAQNVSDSATTPGELDEAALNEDKRRRNTAASARFRIKKKQRVLNLERTIADLEGRADDLEKEAVELRRENGWLKEMVIMKGRRALGLPTSDPREGEASSSGAGPSGSGAARRATSHGAEEGGGEDEEEDDRDNDGDVEMEEGGRGHSARPPPRGGPRGGGPSSRAEEKRPRRTG